MHSNNTVVKAQKIWIGRWTIMVAFLHSLFAVFAFREHLMEIARRGVFNAVGTDPALAATTWFVLFGLLLVILGLTLTAYERRATEQEIPAELGWAMLAICVVGIVLMPVSGFYLMLVPAIAILWRSKENTMKAES